MSLVAPELAEALVGRALKRGGDLGELYVERRTGFAVTLDDERVERPQSGAELGASIRVVRGESSYFGHVDGLAEPDLEALADSVAEAVGADATPAATLPELDRPGAHEVAEPPEGVEAARKAELLRAANEHARSASGEVAQVTASYGESVREVEVYNSDGRAAADSRTRVRLGVQVVAVATGAPRPATRRAAHMAASRSSAAPPMRSPARPRARR